jgi:hypothetical protein
LEDGIKKIDVERNGCDGVQLITLAGSWGMLRDEKFCLLGYNYI